MKHILLCGVMIGLSLIAARADETVRAAQNRLKADGFYHGQSTGGYDSETAAAVTRYQIRHGLAISGQLDTATARALGLPAPRNPASEHSADGAVWRRLRNGDMQFLKKLNAGAIAAPKPPTTPPPAPEAGLDPHAPPPRLAEDVPTAAPPPDRAGPERLRDYVGAFVLAGLDPVAGAELEFFADRVSYFGEKDVRKTRIRRDLVRYDRKWPERRFWLAGDLQVERRGGGKIRVAFPLRYELANGSRRATGKVMKTIALQENSAGDLEITGVNERKL